MPVFGKLKGALGEVGTHFIGDNSAVFSCLRKSEYALLPGFCEVRLRFRKPGLFIGGGRGVRR